MTTKQIQTKLEAEQNKVQAKYEAAMAIRAILDAAKKKIGAEQWDDEGIESEIIEMVTEE